MACKVEVLPDAAKKIVALSEKPFLGKPLIDILKGRQAGFHGLYRIRR